MLTHWQRTLALPDQSQTCRATTPFPASEQE